MYNYEIGYYSHEECPSYNLQHEKQFSQEEISQMVVEALSVIIDKTKKKHSDFEYLIEPVCDYLVKYRGFEYIEFEARWNVFGWASLFDENDWKETDDPKLKYLRDELKKRGYTIWNDSLFEPQTVKILEELCPTHYRKWRYRR